MATKNSFISKARDFDFYKGLNFLNIKGIKPSVTDVSITIDKRTEYRPDLLAYDLYEDSNLWWIFPLRNPDLLRDPVNDMTARLEIKVPTLENIEKIL